jgi:FKBP-type peptidyl-prolyl cis-trans isomerase SlyD
MDDPWSGREVAMSDVVAPEKVVSFHYTLHDNEGDLLDASEEGDPMPYLHGASNIVPGLEKEMLNKKVGDKFKVKVSAEEGYGERIEGSIEVPRSDLPDDVEFEIGMSLVAEDPDGEAFPVWIVELTDAAVIVEPNHPLAGVELNFEVEITAIRAATKDELEHGHPHGPDGHHHDH